MYNLFVSGDENAWNGDPFLLDRSRCVSAGEYTDPEVADMFGDLKPEQIEGLCRLPCVFAYERYWDLDPKLGVLRAVKGRVGRRVQIEYRLLPGFSLGTAADLQSMSVLLDIGNFEMNRTHWAVKDVDLGRELARRGISLPGWASGPRRRIDIRRHRFRVALSFPGEHRKYVARVAAELEEQLGPNSCFYDKWYPAELARPSLDILFQGIYGERSDLVVAFVCDEYDAKMWCGIEWDKIRERRATGDQDAIMYVRVGEGEVSSMSRLDGYIDAREHEPEDMAVLIAQRARPLQGVRRPQ